jgi:hypothetical protein
MMNKLKTNKMTYKYAEQLFILTLVVGLFTIFSYAADIEVTCNDKLGCQVIPTDTPLFSEYNIKPLWSVTKTVKVTNKYNEARQLLINLNDTPPGSFDKNKSLAKVLNVVIKEVESGKTIWSGKLDELGNEESLPLTNIPKNSFRSYKFIVTLSNVGNSYQDKQTKFDIYLGFKTDKESSEDGEGSDGEGQNNPPDVRGDHDFRGFIDQCLNFFHNIFSKFSGHNN